MKNLILILCIIVISINLFSQKIERIGDFIVIYKLNDSIDCAIKKDVITSIDKSSTYKKNKSSWIIFDGEDNYESDFDIVIRTSEISGYKFSSNTEGISGVPLYKEYYIKCFYSNEFIRELLLALNE